MNYKRITVKTLAIAVALICAILTLGILGSVGENDLFTEANRLGEQLTSIKTERVSCEDEIVQAEAKIAEAEEKLPALKKEEAPAEDALKKANDELDEVCPRTYYSSLFCDEAANCEELHTKVSSESSNLSKIRSQISEYETTIKISNKEIEDLTARISELESRIDRVSSERTKAVFAGLFFVLAMLLTIAGLVFLSIFLLSRDDEKKGFIACGLMAASSFLYMCLPTRATALTYILSILIFAIFYSLISGNAQNRLALRVTVIVASVITFFITVPFAPFTSLLYVIAMILASLVLVPCVYTEYLDIAKHIFFTIITFGIWHLIWMYNTTENLNKVEKAEKRAPVRELLLCAFLPLYYIFWTYKTAENTELYGEERGKEFNISILCLALAVICPLLASIIIQDKTNIIVGKPAKEVPAPVVEASSEVPTEEKEKEVTEA